METQNQIASTITDIEHAIQHSEHTGVLGKQLEYLLTQLYHGVSAALEARGLNGNATSLRQQWQQFESAQGGVGATDPHPNEDGDIYVNCQARDALDAQIKALRDSLEEESTRREHEEKLRQESARHEISNRNFNGGITIFSLVAGLIAGNCNNPSCETKSPLSPHTKIFTGTIAGLESLPQTPSVEIACEPKFDGVSITANHKIYIVTVLPEAPTPLELLCTARTQGFKSEATSVWIPRRQERGRYRDDSLHTLSMEAFNELPPK